MACVHVLTRSVRDSAAMLDAVAGPALGYTSLPPVNNAPFLSEVGKDPGRLRIAMVLANPWVKTVDKECLAAVEAAKKLCEQLGHVVKDATAAFAKITDWDKLFDDFILAFIVGMVPAIDERLAELKRPLTDELEPATRECLNRGHRYTALELIRARRTFHAVGVQMAEFQTSYDFDVILSPTLARIPIQHGLITLQNAVPVPGSITIKEFCPFTQVANCTGQPAMSVPLHWTQEQLPVGVQFIGRYADEATLFRLARQLEQAQPWAGKRPPIYTARVGK